MPITISDAVSSPFARLRTLIGGIEPAATPIDLSLGEPRHPMPGFVADIIAAKADDFRRYPPIAGTPDLRQAITDWHSRRYPALTGAIDPNRNILPVTGSREGLFSVIFPARERKQNLARPAVLMPNPFYQCYAAGALAGKTTPIFLTADATNNFLPNLEELDEDTLARTAALYICSPSNPQGAVAPASYLQKAIKLAQAHDFLLISDECYSEIYSDTPPPGILEVCYQVTGGFKNVIAFNSLSKRSNVPGLRSGFVAGDGEFLAQYAKFRNVACPQMPLPIQHASTAIWAEEAHVQTNRDLYIQKINAATRLLSGKFAYKAPKGGFFLWLDMSKHGGGEAATETLWKGYGVKLLPGAYLAMTGPDGKNPGEPFVRVALVEAPDRTEQALTKILKL